MKQITFFLFTILFFAACSSNSDTPTPTTNAEDWLIPRNQVFDGGPGKDGIPSVDTPEFDAASAANLSNEQLVIGIKVGEEVRAYPHTILDWHEIVNDDFNNGEAYAITYCPLTGTAIGWNRQITPDIKTTFGVSGLLYNTNLIPYDRETDSNWSQMRLDCVNGELQSQKIETYPLVETTWGAFKNLYPDAQVMNTNTEFNRSYGQYPYGTYRTDENIIFPIDNDDLRLPRKERVLGVIANDEVSVFRFGSFAGSELRAIAIEIGGQDFVVFGSESQGIMMAFLDETITGETISFPNSELRTDALVDNNGTTWNIFGESADGQQLKTADAYIGYFFAWGAFYPQVEIYDF